MSTHMFYGEKKKLSRYPSYILGYGYLALKYVEAAVVSTATFIAQVKNQSQTRFTIFF